MSSQVELTLSGTQTTPADIERRLPPSKTSYCGRIFSLFTQQNTGCKSIAASSMMIIGGLVLTISNINLIKGTFGGDIDYFPGVSSTDQNGNDASSKPASLDNGLIANLCMAGAGSICLTSGILLMIKSVSETIIARSNRENGALLG